MWVRLVEEGLNENRILLPVACRYLGLSVAATRISSIDDRIYKLEDVARGDWLSLLDLHRIASHM